MDNNINIQRAMKKIFYFMFALLLLTSCEEYLTVDPDSIVLEEEIFANYETSQAYVEQLYNYVLDPVRMALTSTPSFGGECISSVGWHTSYRSVRGDYWGQQSRGFFQSNDNGVYKRSWKGIRIANIGLNGLQYTDATEEEMNLLRGQLLFFRAFLHMEILTAYGSIPYVDKVLSSSDNTLSRYWIYGDVEGYQAVTEKVAEDLTEAAELLPARWEMDENNRGRATSVTALAYKARALLYAGSPLMNEFSGKGASVNTDYMKRAAEAAWACIKEAEGTYSLTPMSDYQSMFTTQDNLLHPWNDEIIWARYVSSQGKGEYNNIIGRAYCPDKNTFGGNAVHESVTQNYIDKFEMADGTLYDPAYDSDNARRWDDRDPRLRQNVYVDRDMAGFKEATRMQLYTGGQTRTNNWATLTPYIISKFWPKGVNKVDGAWNNFRFIIPKMRLAEVYLAYAEAVNEGYGSATSSVPGATLTGLDAVNIVRNRAGQVSTDANGGAHASFRDMILNERAVELCFEGEYWYDIRRWKIGETLHNQPLYSLEFDQDWTPTSFHREEVFKMQFELKHYWMPFQKDQIRMYKDFYQNPGWEN